MSHLPLAGRACACRPDCTCPARASRSTLPAATLFNGAGNPRVLVEAYGGFYPVDAVPDAPKQTLIHLRTRWFDEVERLVGAR